MYRGLLMKINNTVISIVIGDLTKSDYVDAIVNPTNPKMVGHSGLNKAIHLAAGSALRKACEKLGECEVGEAKVTDAYNIPCKYIIHTVGPIWQDGKHEEKELLTSCYNNILKVAKGLQIKSIGFSSISTGSRGFPKDEAATLAVKAVADYVNENPGAFDKILWIVRDEETKDAYDTALKVREELDNVNNIANRIRVPLKAVNWDDIIIYGPLEDNKLQDQNYEQIQVVVRYINQSGKVVPTIIPGYCITVGHWIYAGQSAMEYLKGKGILLCRTILHDQSSPDNDLMKKLHAGYPEYIRQHGYIIDLKTDYGEIQRKTLLAVILEQGKISPKQIIRYIDHMLTINSESASIMSKLIMDKEYVQSYVETYMKSTQLDD